MNIQEENNILQRIKDWRKSMEKVKPFFQSREEYETVRDELFTKVAPEIEKLRRKRDNSEKQASSQIRY